MSAKLVPLLDGHVRPEEAVGVAEEESTEVDVLDADKLEVDELEDDELVDDTDELV